MAHRSLIGFLRLHQQTFWLMAAQFLWGALVSGTVINGWIIAHREEGFFEWSALFVVMMALLGVVFGLSSLWVSLSVISGPSGDDSAGDDPCLVRSRLWGSLFPI